MTARARRWRRPPWQRASIDYVRRELRAGRVRPAAAVEALVLADVSPGEAARLVARWSRS